jgi:probable HAF family extracellular repeat protein
MLMERCSIIFNMRIVPLLLSFNSRQSAFAARGLRYRISIVLGICCILAFARADTALAQSKDKPDSTTPSVAARYKIDDIGEFAEVADDVKVSLSDDGTVAYWTRKPDGTLHATSWRNGHATTVEDVPGYPNTIARAVNRRGDIAGWMNTSTNPVDSLSTTQGFVRRGGRIQKIPGLGGRDSRVLGMNDRGTVVGTAIVTGGGRHAFVISGSAISDLGTLPSGKSSAANAINNSGVIVGVADIDGRLNHAVLWRNEKIMDLGTLPHGASSSARAINDRGQIAGFSECSDGIHAFLYYDGAMQDLGDLGNDPSAASGINNHGDVVGASNISSIKRHAFLWRNGKMTDLNALLPKGSPWVLANAFSINDRGQIVCSASSKGMPMHVLLLTPE